MRFTHTMGAGILIIAVSLGDPTTAGPSDARGDRLEIQARALLLYTAAAEGRWNDAYSLFDPQERRDTSLEQFITLFRSHRPFTCRELRVTQLEEDPLPTYPVRDWEKSVEVSLRLRVQYSDGRRKTLRDYSDVWVKSKGMWFFAANRRGPIEM